MTDYHSLDRRMLIAEGRLQSHSDQLAAIHKRISDQGETLAKINKTLDRLLWLAIGASLFYSATELGIMETIKRAVL